MASFTRTLLVLAAALTPLLPAAAAERVYRIDPDHTYPSFEADHMGISVWRGKFNRSEGTIRLDREARRGDVEARIDVASIDFGNDKLNEAARSDMLFDASKYPQAIYRGRLTAFRGQAPTRVEGEFTLHGKTLPLALRIDKFRCVPHPMLKREVCGADASGEFQRDQFGMDAGKEYGFDMGVALRIQVEAIVEE